MTASILSFPRLTIEDASHPNYPGTSSERQLAQAAARRTLFAASELRAVLTASQRTNEIRHPEQDEILRLLERLEMKGADHVA